MNERQRAKFDKRFPDNAGTSVDVYIHLGREQGYSAACQDEAERAQALVAAVEWMLDAFSTVANSEAQIESHSAVADALAAYKGDAK